MVSNPDSYVNCQLLNRFTVANPDSYVKRQLISNWSVSLSAPTQQHLQKLFPSLEWISNAFNHKKMR